MKIAVFFFLSFFLFFAYTSHSHCIFCKKKKHGAQSATLVQPRFVPGPPAIVYKTKKDYHNNVPVNLSSDKAQIVSYPDPKDIQNEPLPTELTDGYLLDNRGIGVNVAFTSITYDAYKDLPKPPALQELKSLIIDNDPLTEMYNCGIRSAYSNLPQQLNDIINAGKLDSLCQKVK